MEFLKQYNILLKKSITDLKVAKNTLRDKYIVILDQFVEFVKKEIKI